ncbi:MAG: tripartite tricarboxylate transporter permease [Bilophila wadsworthia]
MLFIDSLLAALSPFTLAMNFVGVMLGMIVGALPGLGSVVAITICLPFTFGMTSVSAIALLLGVYCGSICGGSIAAVLINTPGTPQSAATAFDGYPMARAGKPGKAIGWALAASIFGGVFSCVILTFAAPQIAVFALQFGPLETCALILMGLTCISSVSANNQFKGLAMGVLGLLLACVGMSPFSAESRFTFDIFALNSGIDLVAVIVGVFALSEVLDRVERMRREARVENGTSCRVQLPSLGEWRGRMSGLVKSSSSDVRGHPPGRRRDRRLPELRRGPPFLAPAREYGQGRARRIIAAESSNNAVTGGALVPSLALGIPGDPVTAIMLATLTIHGVTPGVRLMTENPEMVYATFAVLMLSNLLMYPSCIITTRMFSFLLRIPEQLLMGHRGGAFSIIRIAGNLFDVFVTVFMGIAFMRRTEFPAASGHRPCAGAAV